MSLEEEEDEEEEWFFEIEVDPEVSFLLLSSDDDDVLLVDDWDLLLELEDEPEAFETFNFCAKCFQFEALRAW